MKKFVLITGAAGGIGGCLVKFLAGSGWIVLGTDRSDLIPPNDIKNICQAWLPLDLEKLSSGGDSLEQFKDIILSHIHGDCLFSIVHNAAIQKLGSFERLTLDDWQTSLAVNFLAPVVITKAFLPQLRRQRGSVVHIGSIHSQLTKSGFTAYASTKAALNGLTKALSVELGEFVRVNAIEPAAIATPMLEAGFINSQESKRRLEMFHPTRSIGIPQDVANAVLFLLDPSNSFLNGCVLKLSGGIHNRLHDPE